MRRPTDCEALTDSALPKEFALNAALALEAPMRGPPLAALLAAVCDFNVLAAPLAAAVVALPDALPASPSPVPDPFTVAPALVKGIARQQRPTIEHQRIMFRQNGNFVRELISGNFHVLDLRVGRCKTGLFALLYIQKREGQPSQDG
jgi:hypothetical protein